MKLASGTPALALVVALFAACTPIAPSTPDAEIPTDTSVSDTSVSDTSVSDTSVTDTGSTDAPIADSSLPDVLASDVLASDVLASDVLASDVRLPDATSTPDATPASDATPTPDATSTPDATLLDVRTSDATTIDAPADTTTASDATAPRDTTTASDVAPTLDVTVVDAATDSGGLPPVDASGATLPTPTREAATWGPLRITTRADSGSGLTPTERLVYGYSARRINNVDTERWIGGAWVPFERSTYAYTAAGRIDARFVWRFTSRLTEYQRWRFEYNADGTTRAEHGDVRSGTSWVELMQVTWEWVGGLPAWQRYYVAPSAGALSVKMWENTFEYDATGRFTSYWRIERFTPTSPFALAGRRTPTARASGYVDRDAFMLGGVTEARTWRYDATGQLLEIAGDNAVDRYVYDARGRLQFVRYYTASEGVWNLSREVEIETTDEGGDLTWALDPFPFETWRRDLYGRGNLVDRYRR